MLTPRDLALAALNHADRSPGFPERYLERAFQRNPHLSERDRAFTVHLVQGVLRWRMRLDWMISESVRFSFAKIEAPVLNCLRLGLYQIFFMDRVPESAAVNEAVNQARTISSRHTARVVNGILRNICRNKGQIAFPDSEKDRVRYLSVFYSYPEWLVKKWIGELGNTAIEALLSAGNQLPSLVIRTNTLKVTRLELVQRLKRENVETGLTNYSPEGLVMKGLKGPINKLGAFREGLFQVQGEAAQLCAHLLDPRPGETILDLCTGMGGKATHLAQLMGNTGRIIALDRVRGRLVRLGQTSRRLGIRSIFSVSADASTLPSSAFKVAFDRIMVDGPCSGLGVISRHPDGKWSTDESDPRRLSLLQGKILDRALPLLSKGGRMLYVTCTLSEEENEGVVGAFLERHKGTVLEDLREHVPDWGVGLIDDHGLFKSLPHVHGIEGFFAALFTRKDG